MTWLLRTYLPTAAILFLVGAGLATLGLYEAALWVAGVSLILGVGLVVWAYINPRWQSADDFDAWVFVIGAAYLVSGALGEAFGVAVVALIRWI